MHAQARFVVDEHSEVTELFPVQFWHGAHDVPLPKYPELHTQVLVSYDAPLLHAFDTHALASQTLHWAQLDSSPVVP